MTLFGDLVCAAEHLVDVLEVVCAREQGLCGSSGAEVLLQVSFLAEVAHLRELVCIDHVHRLNTYIVVCLRRHHSS